MDATRKRELLERLVQAFCEERGMRMPAELRGAAATTEDLWDAFRALVNTREPGLPAAEILADQDELLQGLIAEAGVSSSDAAVPSPADARLRLWRGDITTLAADAIVNAANAQMLGCWVPGHYCIDNAIHTFAGVQLRAECAALMDLQGHEEPTGQAKVTAAYNLPAKRIIHTVGPIANGRPTARHHEQLASSYRACLDAAAAEGLASIAFCCISTGVFGFPQEEAANIAVRTVREWVAARDAAGRPAPTIIFNVFGATDEAIYRRLLGL